MKTLSIIALMASAALGTIAAWYWWKASQGANDPFFGRVESADPNLSTALLANATAGSINESAQLNKIAALLTGLSVGIGAIGNALSVFS